MYPAPLLQELCAQLGFCLPLEGQKQLVESPPSTVDAFTDEVIRREGLDPLTLDSGIRMQVRAVVAQHMGAAPWSPAQVR